MPLAWSEFATLRQSLLKTGARVVEKAARIRIHFALACPDAALSTAGRPARRLRPLIAGAPRPANPSPFNTKPQHLQSQIPAPHRRRTQTPARAKSADTIDLP